MIVEIVRLWAELSTFPTLIYSKNRANVDLIHMALIKSGIASLCLTDESFSKVWNSADLQEAPSSDQNLHVKLQVENLSHKIVQNNNYFDCVGFNKDVVKGVVDLFKIVCCTSNEMASGSLESKAAFPNP